MNAPNHRSVLEPGLLGEQAAADDVDRELLVHGVGLDVLGVVVDELLREAEPLEALHHPRATAASWSPRTPRGDRAPRRAADGAGRRATCALFCSRISSGTSSM